MSAPGQSWCDPAGARSYAGVADEVVVPVRSSSRAVYVTSYIVCFFVGAHHRRWEAARVASTSDQPRKSGSLVTSIY
jgi:hypothetical protein